MSTQYTAFWCFFYAWCMYRAWRGAFKSIVSGSLWFLSMGFTRRKCLSVAQIFDLQISIPNCEWNENWLHIGHGKSTGRSRSELLHLQNKINEIASWMDLKGSKAKNFSWKIGTILKSFLVSSNSCHAFFHLSSDPWWRCKNISEDRLWFSRIQLLHHYLWWNFHDGQRWVNFFHTAVSGSGHSPCSTSVQILYPIGMVGCGRIGTFTSLWFCFGTCSACKIPHLQFSTRLLRTETSEVSCLLLFKFVTNFLRPWKSMTLEWELSFFKDTILIPTTYLPCKQQDATSNTGPNLFPRIQPLGSVDFSSLGKVYSRHARDSVNCENSAIFSSWNTVHFPKHSETRFPTVLDVVQWRSICSVSLWLSSLISLGCLLLKSWPPGINPLLTIDWRLNAHPMW